MFCLHVCLCSMCIKCSQRLEEGIDHQELELQMVVIHLLGAGNRTQVL